MNFFNCSIWTDADCFGLYSNPVKLVKKPSSGCTGHWSVPSTTECTYLHCKFLRSKTGRTYRALLVMGDVRTKGGTLTTGWGISLEIVSEFPPRRRAQVIRGMQCLQESLGARRCNMCRNSEAEGMSWPSKKRQRFNSGGFIFQPTEAFESLKPLDV